ncbi:hypothetical protein [Orrella dioscoreae]|uniref:hypothetical protein n=1 Tax=Orrella dioscoreae TaxID=1851544 RepID=UPI000832BFCF|nr:hypothetical protein [Orrella dioscoreae]
MDEFLTWGFILKAVAVWVGVYFLQPLLFVLRDKALNWYVEKYVLTEELDTAILQRAADVWVINNRSKVAQVKVRPEGITYLLNGEEVTEDQYAAYERMMNFHTNREASHARLIRNCEFQLKRLFHHYKQDSKSPIPTWEKAAYERQEALHKAQDQDKK